jgi:beta-aspartyl-peptidase (threonine type)
MNLPLLKYLFRIALIFILFWIPLGVCAETPVPPGPEVTKALQEGVEAWNAGDLSGFMKGYLDSPDMTYTSSGRIIRGYQALQKRYQDTYGSDKASMGHLSFDQIEVLPLGTDHALALGHWHLELSKGKGKDLVEGVFSLILRKTPQGWKILHDHTSKGTDPSKG